MIQVNFEEFCELLGLPSGVAAQDPFGEDAEEERADKKEAEVAAFSCPSLLTAKAAHTRGTGTMDA